MNVVQPIASRVTSHNWHAWVAIVAVVVTSIAGNILMAKAARSNLPIQHRGMFRSVVDAIWSFGRDPVFLAGLACMAFSFFSWLFALSHWDLSFAGPATASLTFIGNTLAAKVFLGEIVDSRRWMSAVLVCCGVVLLGR